jgi:hypothetical protein
VQVNAVGAITVRLAGYIRVSTGSQLDGFGLEDQERIVRRWTRQHGRRLVKLFVEKAVSETVAGDERPESAAALSWVEDKKVDGSWHRFLMPFVNPSRSVQEGSGRRRGDGHGDGPIA